MESTGKGLLAFNDGKWHNRFASFGMARTVNIYIYQQLISLMPKKYFVIELDPGVEIRIMIETANGVVVNYVVKLLIIQNNKHIEVIRFDNAHGCPHKDLLDKHGNIVRKTWYDFFDNQQGLDMAIKDIKDNYELYIERFTRWSQK